MLKLPPTSNSIQKGVPLKLVLDQPAVQQLAENIHFVYQDFDKQNFVKEVEAVERLCVARVHKEVPVGRQVTGQVGRRTLKANKLKALVIVVRLHFVSAGLTLNQRYRFVISSAET